MRLLSGTQGRRHFSLLFGPVGAALFEVVHAVYRVCMVCSIQCTGNETVDQDDMVDCY
jgi:hypothetical protein